MSHSNVVWLLSLLVATPAVAAPAASPPEARPPARPPAAAPAKRPAPTPAARPAAAPAPTRRVAAAPAPAVRRARPAPAPTTASRLKPGAVLNEASNQFSFGRYRRVVALLRPLVERDLLTSRDDQVEALRLYGICLYLTGRKAAALRIFQTLVSLAPETRLDPRLVQPEVVAAFERIRRSKLLQIRRAARRKLHRRYGFLNLLPPVGQFQNGHWRKGVTVLSLELAFLGANIGTYYALRSRSLRQPDRTFVEKDAQGNVIADHRPLARALQVINISSLVLLCGTVVYGIIDGYVHYMRRKRSLERLLQQPMTLLPMPTADGGGVALTVRFE